MDEKMEDLIWVGKQGSMASNVTQSECHHLYYLAVSNIRRQLSPSSHHHDSSEILLNGYIIFSSVVGKVIIFRNVARQAPRSGLAWKHSIDVGAGVIDADYRGVILGLVEFWPFVDFL
ncbi:hypothetical protein POM88_020139 [Heracleum sosnowskyi]|uniref:dUTP diphosphatase n=1 Tax=Heracleum sosnowskyi TaxID=360622 RepID=A0AAD8IAZ7_9APIA|nr:hypothetical protein POM88_020139 [Heracleum sosnowskyi]